MNNIEILDCTLRDGGYINSWNFGYKTIKRVIKKLSASNVDIIECGFIRDVSYDLNKSVFDDTGQFEKVIAYKKEGIKYVAMIDPPYIGLDKIRLRSEKTFDGIRLTFHEDRTEINQAIEYATQLMKMGYDIFIQPIATATFSDENIVTLIKRVNTLKPYAFYIVDTLGTMTKNDLLRLYYLLDNNLESIIKIGFHSHNNLQLSFSNAQELLMLHSKRDIIIDSSVFGMGRGAGNLCTELITHYINEHFGYKYELVPLLEIFDEHLSTITQQTQWGYSIPLCLAAIHQCHPNYASHLMTKQPATVKSIDMILGQLPKNSKHLFDMKLIDHLYTQFQGNLIDNKKSGFTTFKV